MRSRFCDKYCTKWQRLKRRSLSRGSASVEYVVVTGAVVALLFLPLVELGNTSLVEHVLNALKAFQRHTTYLLSLP